MKSINIKRAVLAAALFAGAGMAYGNDASLHVVFCKATVASTNSCDNTISVTLPPTEGYYDENGDPLTYWNVGNVCPGGVADSWHGEGGPGRFTAKNDGTVRAYFYVMTGHQYEFNAPLDGRSESIAYGNYIWDVKDSGIFGNVAMLSSPVLSPDALRRFGFECAYHLAFTTDVTAKIPTWHSLDRGCVYSDSGSGGYYWITEDEVDSGNFNNPYLTAGFMGCVDPGDYLSFDLKFWLSPRYKAGNPDPVMFTFCVTASAFPLWGHNLAVE